MHALPLINKWNILIVAVVLLEEHTPDHVFIWKEATPELLLFSYDLFERYSVLI